MLIAVTVIIATSRDYFDESWWLFWRGSQNEDGEELTCVKEYDDGRRRYQLVGDCLSHLGYIRIYMTIVTLSIIISTHWPKGEWMIGTHHILDGGTREKAIKETVPVPEDMGEDEVPDGHSCQEIVGTQEQENWRYKQARKPRLR